MKRKILFVHYGDDWIRGSEKCLLDLIKYMEHHHYACYVWTNSRELSKQLELMNVPNQLNHFPLLLGWKPPKYNVSGWLGLIKHGCEIIEREKIDLVHINSGASCQWMLAAARMKKVPVVTQLHCPYPARDRLTLGLHLSPHIISVSQYVAEFMTKDGYPNEKISVIHNGIDTVSLSAQQKVDVKEALSIPEQDFVFATVGSLIHRKGVDRIITAMRHVTFEYPNVSLVVIGDGDLMDKLVQQASRLHLSNHIHFVGEQSNVVGWLKGCDAFISGARSEAFGLAVAEAALAKIPVIAPLEGGIPEFITHGETGILYQNQGTGPLEKAMRVLINHPELCQQYGMNGFDHITQNHDLSVSCRKVELLYRGLLEQPFVANRSPISTLSPLKTYVVNRLSFGGQHD